MHTHTAPIHSQSARDVSQMELWIAYGVTSVADKGSDIGTLKAWADRRNGFAAPVPRVFYYGSMIEGLPFIWGGSALALQISKCKTSLTWRKGRVRSA